jgi:hypothetical protein
VSHSVLLFTGGFLTFFCLFLILADYGWESKKRRGLDARVRPSAFGMRSERSEYEWYSWIRYLVIILLAYLNSVGEIASVPAQNESLASPLRMVWAFSLVILFSVVLLAVDEYWDRKRRRGLNGLLAGVFWSYFWLRYPALILATIAATKAGLSS